MDIFNLSEDSNFGLKSKTQNSNLMFFDKQIQSRQTDDPLLKTYYPLYLYKPPFGYPRNLNVVFYRELARNPYVFSVIKAITDQAAEADWDIVPKEGVDIESNIEDLDFDKLGINKEGLEEFGFKTLNDAKNFMIEFYRNPNSDNESFAQLLRKVIPDILVLDSGCFVKVYNKNMKLVELRAIDGGCLGYNSRIETDIGMLKIGEIVKDKIQCNVKSYNQESQEIEWKPITNWFRNGATNKWRYIKAKTNNKFRSVKCTSHNIYTPNGKVNSDNLKVGDNIYVQQRELNETQKQILLGSILGDGQLCERSSCEQGKISFRIGHTAPQLNYLKWKMEHFTPFNPSYKESYSKFHESYSDKWESKLKGEFVTECDMCFEEYNNMSISEVFKKIDALGLAIWIQDDGYITPKNELHLSTHAINKKNQEKALEILQQRFGIKGRLVLDKRCNKWWMRFSSNNTKIFKNLVSNYMHPDLHYKFGVSNDNLTIDNNVKYNICESKIFEIIESNRIDSKYDIEVADNHNYFAQGVLVSNSILKNPDRHGSISRREGVIIDDSYFGLNAGKGFDKRAAAYKDAIKQYNSYGYTDQAAYFQFAYGVNYSVPIPYGKDEIIYMMENPSTETVYSRASALESAKDITLNLIYSSKASLDLFLNANIPSGIIQLAEATQEDAEAFQNSFYQKQYSGFDEYGFQRKVNGRMPVVGNPNVNFIPLNFNTNESQVIQIQQWFTKVLWSCFGVTASEMGFTEDSNKSVDESQTKVNARKAVKPRLNLIANYLNDQVQPDLPFGSLFEFTFKDHDVNQDIKTWEMYEKKINLGVMTPKQVAEEVGIEYEANVDTTKSSETKSMDTETGGGGLTDNALGTTGLGVEDKRKTKLKDNPCEEGYEMYGTKQLNGKTVPNCVPKTDLKSVYEFDDNIVVTGKTPLSVLEQTLKLVEDSENKEDNERTEDETLTDSIYTGADEYNKEVESMKEESELKSDNKYKLPQSARNNAKKVLEWKEEHGDEVKGMTSTGWNRARQLADNEYVNLETVKKMAQFNRHRKNAKISEEHKNEPWKDNGYVAWLGWGGDSGIDWAIEISENNETETKSNDNEDPISDKEQEEMYVESPIERVMKDYIKKVKQRAETIIENADKD